MMTRNLNPYGRGKHGVGRNEQVQTAGAMELVLIRAVAHLTDPVEEYGPSERILLFTFIKADVAATT